MASERKNKIKNIKKCTAQLEMLKNFTTYTFEVYSKKKNKQKSILYMKFQKYFLSFSKKNVNSSMHITLNVYFSSSMFFMGWENVRRFIIWDVNM